MLSLCSTTSCDNFYSELENPGIYVRDESESASEEERTMAFRPWESIKGPKP